MASIFESITVLNKIARTKKVGGVIIDGILEEVHIGKSNVTKLPIEDGSEISDHITNEPNAVTIKGVITNTPLFTQKLRSGFSGVSVFGDRVTEAYEGLQRIREDKQLVTVVTILQIYSDMAIESLTQMKDQTTGQSMNVTMTLVHINKVTNQVVSISNDVLGGEEEDQLQAQANASAGQTVSETPPDDLTILLDAALQLEGL